MASFNLNQTFPIAGYNPLFDESFEFQVNLPELALVRFAVLDDDYIGDEFISQYTIPFDCMQTGMFIACRRVFSETLTAFNTSPAYTC